MTTYVICKTPPCPSPKAGISSQSGPFFLLNPDPASPFSTQPSSLLGGCTALGLNPAALILSCLLWSPYRDNGNDCGGFYHFTGVPWLGHPFLWEVSHVLHSFRCFAPSQWGWLSMVTSALFATFSPQQFLFYIRITTKEKGKSQPRK